MADMLYRKYLLSVAVNLKDGTSFITSTTKWGYNRCVTEAQILKWEETLVEQFKKMHEMASGVSSVAVIGFTELYETTDKIGGKNETNS